MVTCPAANTARIPYRPAYAVGTEKSLQGDSALYAGTDIGPNHFTVKRTDIFNPNGTPKETMSVVEVLRVIGYDPQKQESIVVPETSEGLVQMVVDGIKQQVPKV